ncbi:MAG: glycosyltransferase family 1 protein [Betaproteobacteria bacterium]|uniref:Glycosyltransferase family 1 protein n=1 Tax=Candidatus Proximibacter danicus TaxID=2954365 RepID=A0A9D7PR13_9PROT|nr:glycosyltransferase family 1 protein [Candidatus Proximibacter danicus]
MRSAAGALLLARPCGGFSSLGFRDGESAIVLDESDPAEQVVSLISDPDRLQSIATAGQELVWEKHSIQARSQQMESALHRILDGSFNGSVWENGEFVLID